MDNTESHGLQFDEDGIREFREMRKWTNFLSVCGFILIGLTVVSSVIYFIRTFVNFNALELASWQVAPLLLLGAVYFFPVYCLFKFSKYSAKAIQSSDRNSFNLAFRYLNLHYRFMGILLIVVLIFYLVAGSFMLFNRGVMG